MKLLLGKDTQSDQSVYLTAEGARAVLVCGKRGSGKSYTVGVLVEELLTAGGRNIIPIIVDPMGVYHTMVQPNTAQQNELFSWGLSTKTIKCACLFQETQQRSTTVMC